VKIELSSFWKEHIVRVCAKRVLRESDPKMEEQTGRWGILDNEELHNLQSH